jgi:hypothetical protein
VGLTFSAILSWAPHINRITKNAKCSMALLYRARPYLSPAALATIYKSHIRSRMEYCSPIWTGAPSTQLLKLDAVQKNAARIMGLKQARLLQSLAHRRGVSGLCLTHRILHKTAPSAVHDLCPTIAPPHLQTTRHNIKTPRFFTPPIIKRADPNYYTRSHQPLFTNIFNTLPIDAQKEPNLQKFKCRANVHDFVSLWTETIR